LMDVDVDLESGRQTKDGEPKSRAGSSAGKFRGPLSAKFILLLLALLGLGAGFAFLRPTNEQTATSSAADEKVALCVDLASVQPFLIERKLSLSGTVWAWDPVQVGAEVSGLRVVDVLVDDGQMVEKGQTLARLNSKILEAQLERQGARLKAARAGLVKAIQPNRPEDLLALKAAYAQTQSSVSQEEANLVRAQANAAEALANANRYYGLVQQGAVSAQDYDNRVTLSKVCQAEVLNCEHKVKAAKFVAEQAYERMTMGVSGGRREDVDISRAQVAEIQANYDELRSQLAQTTILAPVSGLVLKRYVHVGDIANSGKAMFDLVRDARLELRAQVSEPDLARLSPGQLVKVISGSPLATSGSQVIDGKIREISPLIDENTRLGTARIDLPALRPGAFALRPGNFVKSEVLLGKSMALAVPSSSIIYRNNRALVFSVDEKNRAHMRFVQLGERTGSLVEVILGINKNEKVVEKGAGFLKEGDLVKVSEKN
jgi:HlyD family secretion protein